MIMTTQHTPGPWEVCDLDWQFRFVEGSYELGLKAISTPNIKHYIATEIDAADARLIAAAPDLLAALEVVREYMDHAADQFSYEDIVQIRAAIAKAKGAA